MTKIKVGLRVIADYLDQERTRWVLWIPIALGFGIGTYFALPFEPTWTAYGLGVCLILCSSIVLLFYPSALAHFCAWALLWATVGFGAILGRTSLVNPYPLVQATSPLWITGTVQFIDHPASSQRLFQRVTLRLKGASSLPKQVLLTIRTTHQALQEGDLIRLKARLEPLPGPCFPGGYHPRRQYFFQGIGASGFSLTSPQVLSRKSKLFPRWRHTLTRTLHAQLSPPLGALACSLVTGDTAALPSSVREAFSESGMAHLLAISGLHISIILGLCFVLFQRSLGYISSLALYVNLDKIAAFLSLLVGWIYLNLSGQRYPAQRSFMMMAAAMIAMVLSRRRHSLRILALCASCFLIVTPEALVNIGYQLSFMSVASLLAFYDFRRQRALASERAYRLKAYLRKPRHPLPETWRQAKKFFFNNLRGRSLLWSLKNSMSSSLVVTVMTLPLMTFHFYHVSFQGLIANMVAIPFTGLIVMPLGLMAIISLKMPWALWILTVWGYALQGLWGLAKFSAHYLSFLLFAVPTYRPLFFIGAMAGLWWTLLWQRPWRWWGILPLIISTIGSYTWGREKVTFLIDGNHKLIGYIDRPSRTLYVSSLRKGKFVARRWAQAYGLKIIAKFDPHTVVMLPDGKTAVLDPQTIPPYADFFISWTPLPTSRPHLVISQLPLGIAYAIVGAGKKIISTAEDRPWGYRSNSPKSNPR